MIDNWHNLDIEYYMTDIRNRSDILRRMTDTGRYTLSDTLYYITDIWNKSDRFLHKTDNHNIVDTLLHIFGKNKCHNIRHYSFRCRKSYSHNTDYNSLSYKSDSHYIQDK